MNSSCVGGCNVQWFALATSKGNHIHTFSVVHLGNSFIHCFFTCRHGNGRVFSCKGIWLVVEYFRNRGMSDKDITVFVPQWRKEPSKPESPITDQDILFRLEREGVVVFTPSKKMQGRRIVCYDDRFIVKRAADTGGVIVSNDAFRDLLSENEEWRETIEKRVLMFCFANDVFMVPQDPLGRYGPSLEDMLRFSNKSSPVKASASEKRGGQVTCPYGERCTFGSKCRFYHPERGDSSNKTRSRSTTPTPLHVRTGSSTEDLYASQKDTDQLTDKMRALQFQSSPQPTDIYTQKPSDYRCYSDSNVSHIPERPHPSQRHPYTFPLVQLPKHHSRPNDTSDKSSNNLYPEKIENSPYLSRDVPDTQCYEVPSLRHDTYPQAVPHPQYSMHQDVRTCVPQAYLPNPRPNYMQQCHSPVQSYQSPAAMGHQSYQYHHQPMLHSSSPSPHHAGGGREAFVPCPVQNYRQYDRPQSKRQYDETQFRGLH